MTPLLKRCRLLCVFLSGLIVYGCEQQQPEPAAPAGTTPPTTAPTTAPTMPPATAAASPSGSTDSLAPNSPFVNSPQPASTPVEPLAPNAEPVFTGSVDELRAAAAQDQQAFRDAHDRQPVQLSGTLAAVGVEPDGQGYLSLDSQDGEPLRCHVAEPKPWLVVTPGQPVTVKGRCLVGSDAANPLTLAQTLIVDAGQPTIEEFTTAQLAGKFADNAAQAMNEYSGRFVIVSGMLAGLIDGRVANNSKITLEGQDGSKLDCNFGKGMVYSELVRTYPREGPARVMGRVTDFNEQYSRVILEDCVPMPVGN